MPPSRGSGEAAAEGPKGALHSAAEGRATAHGPLPSRELRLGLSGSLPVACRLQEVREESSSGSVAQLDPGDPGARGLPATVECELREDLAGSCCPGELVRVRGFLRAVGADLAASGPGMQHSKLSPHMRSHMKRTPCMPIQSACGREAVSGFRAWLRHPHLLVLCSAARGRKVDQRAFEMYIRAESVKNLSRSPLEAHPRCSAPPGSRSFSPHDRALMHGFAEEHKGRVFQQLLHSLCPSIPGHEPLKGASASAALQEMMQTPTSLLRLSSAPLLPCHMAGPFPPLRLAPLCLFCAAGLVLSLFGGVLKAGAWEHSATPAARSNIHVLILGERPKTPVPSGSGVCSASLQTADKAGSWKAAQSVDLLRLPGPQPVAAGDPGVGKSQLLRAAAAVSPGSTYVCGTGASSAGLTLSVIKDADLTGESVQEAGTLQARSGSLSAFKSPLCLGWPSSRQRWPACIKAIPPLCCQRSLGPSLSRQQTEGTEGQSRALPLPAVPLFTAWPPPVPFQGL